MGVAMSRLPLSRRNVFRAGGALAATAVLPPLAMAGMRPVRRNIDDLSMAELAAYEHAVRLLQQRAGDVLHPTLRQAMAMDNGCGAFQRIHLERIEARLRAADPVRTASIVIPYWDFTALASGRNYPRAFERAGSPLFAGEDGQAALDPIFWSYHAYIDTIWQRWEDVHGPATPGTGARLWLGPARVEIRTIPV